MPNKLIISLISEQTIPNVQFLKWYANKYPEEGPFDLLFISTDKMEQTKKSVEIMNALNLLDFNYEYHYTINVDPNNLSDVVAQLQYFFEDYPHPSLVANITGGTKIMSLGVYQVLEKTNESVIYYKPIAGYLEKIYPTKEMFQDNLQLTIDEYFKAVGCDYTLVKDPINSFDYVKLVRQKIIMNINALKVFNNITEKNSDNTFNLIFQKEKPSNKYSSQDVDAAFTLCKELNINPEKIPTFIPKYILGGWYEEYVYHLIKEQLSLTEDNILRNLKIEGVENEFDVIYMYDNKLHVIECKAFMKEKTEGKKIVDALYKLISLRERLGKSVELALYTTTQNISDSIKLRAINSNVEIKQL